MAAVVYGGSPRQHNRLTGGHHLHSSQNVPPPVPTHQYGIHHSSLHPHPLLPPPASYQNLPPPPSTNLIIMPPPLYMTSETTTMSTTSQYHQYSSSHDQQPLSLPPLPPTPTHSHHYHQQFQHHSSVMCRQNNTKRKSAVELLAESKPFYVKSENVLDRSQHLHFRSLSGGFGVCTSSAVNSTPISNNYLCMEQQTHQQPQSRLSSTLISPSRLHNSHQNRIANRRSASTSSDLLQTKLRKLLNADSKDSDYQYNPSQHSDYYNSSSKDCDIIENQSNKISVSDLSLTLLSPPPNSDEDYYPPDDPLLTEDFSTISPPAEYACNSNEASPIKEPPKNKSNYQRSYSNSHESQPSDEHDYSSTSCHKSLPDLHSQMGVTNRHSPHSEVLSCCSRGNRSNKSGGSSLNRDSGGSSGHYTHRSDPCCKQQQMRQQQPHYHNPPHQVHDRHYSEYYRRDSGSSTQHSGNSYYVSGRPDCAECLLNFTTPEVPEAFQDDYPTITRVHRNSNAQDISPPPGTFKRQKCLRNKHLEEQYETAQSGNGKPILRSKSDISDRYWRNCQPPPQAALPSPPYTEKIRKSESLSQLEIFFDRLGLDDDKFNEIYSTPKRKTSTGSESSDTVFFSDVSTIDSSKLAADNTSETQTQTTTPIYRPSEPTSIVERNARIIKWLCNCRKMQAVV